MYFPWEAAACNLTPALFALCKPTGVMEQRRIAGSLGPGCWALGAGCPLAACLVHHSIWQRSLLPTEPDLRSAARPKTRTGGKQDGHEWLRRARKMRASWRRRLRPFASLCRRSSAGETKLAAMVLPASKGSCQARHCYLCNGMKVSSERWYIKEKS